MNPLFMLDLCAGLGGASQAMKARGWKVITLDADPRFHTDIVADVRSFFWERPRPDLIWASPPCQEFSRQDMPWLDHSKAPDMSIMLGCLRLINMSQPRYWVIENVRGAVHFFQRYLGRPRVNIGPFYLWGHFPPLRHVRLRHFTPKKSVHGTGTQRAELRARIPNQISEQLALAVERQHQFWDFHPLSPSFTVAGGTIVKTEAT